MKYPKVISGLLLLINISVVQAQDWAWMKGDKTGYKAGEYGTQGTGADINNPGSRSSSSSWNDNLGNLWLFGGNGLDGTSNQDALNDLWKYNIVTGYWTWVKGVNGTQQASIYGEMGVPGLDNSPGGRSGASSWIDTFGNLWLFGGTGYDYSTSNGSSENYLNDLWKYDPVLNTWTWMKGDTVGYQTSTGTLGIEDENNKPAGRMQSAFWKDNADNLWVFGGLGVAGFLLSDPLNGLWKYNMTSGNWILIKGEDNYQRVGIYGTQSVPDDNNIPGGRMGPTSWTDNSGNFWLFGGAGYDYTTTYPMNNYLNDLWKYNPATNQWTWMKGDTVGYQYGRYGTQGVADGWNNPGGRLGASGWVDNSGNLWLFGGFGLDAFSDVIELNDLWMFNPSTGNWIFVKGDSAMSSGSYAVFGTQGTPDPNNSAGGRQFAVSWIDDATNNPWIFGGIGFDESSEGNTLNDLWRLSGGPLPVELQSFTASIVNNNIKLLWTTVTEVNNYGFEIERASSGTMPGKGLWERIGFVKGSGNSNSKKEYSFVDKNLTAGNYSYRLKQVDNNGKFEYSKTADASLIKPVAFSLQQNYPNPFNPSTTIKYDLAEQGKVALKIYDILGNEIKTLVNETEDAGTYQVNFNAEGLSSGVYIYELKTDKFTSAKTLMVLK